MSPDHDGILICWKISDLSDSKTWKFIGNLNSGGSLNLPSEFNELNFCFVILSGTTMVETSMVAPYDILASVDRYYRTGYYANSNSNASFSVLASRSRVTGLNVWQNGSDLTNTSNIACRVYYR